MITPFAKLHQRLPRLPFLLFLATLVAVLLKHKNQTSSCQGLLNTGRWSINLAGHNSRRRWHTYETLLYPYNKPAIEQCLRNQTLHFAGDSTIRQIFWAVAEKLGGENARTTKQNAGKHQDLTHTEANVTLSFSWDPYLERAGTLETISSSVSDGISAGTLLSTGLWQTRFSGGDFLQEVRSTIKNITDMVSLKTKSKSTLSNCYLGDCAPVILIPPPHLDYDLLDPERANTLTELSMNSLTDAIHEAARHTNLEVVWAAQQLTFDASSALDGTGLHVTNETATLQADILLNRICNNRVLQGNRATAHACVELSKFYKKKWLLGFCLCFTICMVAAVTTLLAIVSYCRLTDRTPIFAKSDKVTSQSLFVFSMFALLAVCLCSARCIRKSNSTKLPTSKAPVAAESSRHEFLSRSQTEEWKGWMQVVILLYHYFGMSKVLWVYQLVRVLVASYLFLTGYGHATNFQTSGDFTSRRLVAVLLRLNALPILLAFFMNNTYDFYYFPGLASFWGLVTYMTFWSHARSKVSFLQYFVRIAASLGIMKLLLSSERMITILTQLSHAVHGPDIDPKEFIFRVGLDVYAPYFGMMVSILVKQSETFSKLVIQLRSGRVACVQQLIHFIAALLFLGFYLLKAGCFPDKYSYNRWHSMLSLLPISAYILLRNANSYLRNYEVPTFRWIGTISLELFVLQYHVWLAADAKGILRLGLLDTPLLAASKTVASSWTFWAETAVITVVFVWLSDCCAQANTTIVKTFVSIDDSIPGNRQHRVLLGRVAILLIILWLNNFTDLAVKLTDLAHGV